MTHGSSTPFAKELPVAGILLTFGTLVACANTADTGGAPHTQRGGASGIAGTQGGGAAGSGGASGASGTSSGGSSGAAVPANPDIKVVIMTGGGNDILLNNRQCLVVPVPGDTQCHKVVDDALAKATQLLSVMASKGVKQIGRRTSEARAWVLRRPSTAMRGRHWRAGEALARRENPYPKAASLRSQVGPQRSQSGR